VPKRKVSAKAPVERLAATASVESAVASLSFLWLEKHPRFKLHFTPTSASWLSLVERFFAEITSRRIRRGSYSSVDDLEAAIYDYLAHHNEKPRPFKWTKTAEDILTRERRALDKLDETRGNR
tara:strand:- start:2576 stop:2944 length:369 start_codon:yes stop_codon:yes gene_type:complete